MATDLRIPELTKILDLMRQPNGLDIDMWCTPEVATALGLDVSKAPAGSICHITRTGVTYCDCP